MPETQLSNFGILKKAVQSIEEDSVVDALLVCDQGWGEWTTMLYAGRTYVVALGLGSAFGRGLVGNYEVSMEYLREAVNSTQDDGRCEFKQEEGEHGPYIISTFSDANRSLELQWDRVRDVVDPITEFRGPCVEISMPTSGFKQMLASLAPFSDCVHLNGNESSGVMCTASGDGEVPTNIRNSDSVTVRGAQPVSVNFSTPRLQRCMRHLTGDVAFERVKLRIRNTGLIVEFFFGDDKGALRFLHDVHVVEDDSPPHFNNIRVI